MKAQPAIVVTVVAVGIISTMCVLASHGSQGPRRSMVKGLLIDQSEIVVSNDGLKILRARVVNESSTPRPKFRMQIGLQQKDGLPIGGVIVHVGKIGGAGSSRFEIPVPPLTAQYNLERVFEDK